MPSRGSAEVGQRRFWNVLQDKPGIMYIQNTSPEAVLYSDTGFEASLSIFDNGPIVFPPEHKMARVWGIKYYHEAFPLTGVDFDGPGAWIFKPYSTDFTLVAGDAWARGADWRTANLFYDSSHHAIPTTLHYAATGDTPAGEKVDIAWAYNPDSGAQGFGTGGLLYGYLNDVYFGNNEMGGNKPNIGVGPKRAAIGDLSKSSSGLWGAFGISHGTCINNLPGCVTSAKWEFDLCWRPAAMLVTTFNNQVAHLNEGGDTQSEGWGTDIVAIVEATVEFDTGEQEEYRQFTVDVSPARSTMNVYTVKGEQLTYGIDYVHDDCDRSGRSYRLLDTDLTNPGDPCARLYALIVTYLVVASTLQPGGDRKGRVTDTNIGSNRLSNNDVRGL